MLLNRNEIVILDTETTGLGDDARVCEIAIIDGFGNTLFNSLVNPEIEIPADATAIHGITNQMVSDSPVIIEHYHEIRSILSGMVLCIYNSDYDVRVLNNHFKNSPTPLYLWDTSLTAFCVMQNYAEFYGEINRYGSYKWQRLTNACQQQQIDITKFTAHRALADCQMTLSLMNEFINIED